MKTHIVSTSQTDAIDLALKTLAAGEVIAFPTDTVYGIAALAFNSISIQKLYEIKGRDFSKAIPVLISSFYQVSLISTGLNPTAIKLARAFWPGALTLVVPRHPNLPGVLTRLPTVGIRMPDHSFVLKLIDRSGPLAATSANRSGEANPLTAENVFDQLGDRISLILDGGKTPGEIPSTVIDCSTEKIVILRYGAISREAIDKKLTDYTN
jgi:L-threonylcarbamoyladenylate synthase